MTTGATDRAAPNRRQVVAGLIALSALSLLETERAVAVTKFDPVLADVHRRTFDYFWDTTDAKSGLAPDNWPDPRFASIAATGFAITAFCIGARSGYVSREAAAARALTTLRTLWTTPQGDGPSGISGHRGFFYHFLHVDSGLRYHDVELSSVDTALLMLGVLTAAAYFDGGTADEVELRKLGTALYERVDWTFLARGNGLISMGWHPDSGLIGRSWDHYNEGMMVNLLALGSATHPVSPRNWIAWAATLDGTWGANFGTPHLGFSPLFGHQYSHCWYDFRGIADAYMRGRGSDYFINSQRATEAQRNYAIRNPGGFADYGANIWGLTACQGPGRVTTTVGKQTITFRGYAARGPQTGDHESIDDGTIAPTAGVSSVAFAPEICIPLVDAMRRRYGDEIYGRYGFTDAFNPSFPRTALPRHGSVKPRAGWVADAFLGIDQGPILLMLENYRSGFVWNVFCRSPLTGPIVRRGLRAAGFAPVASSGRWLA